MVINLIKNSTTKREFKSYVGLFLAAAELSRKNLQVNFTPFFQRGFDVVLVNPETHKSIVVQVKGTDLEDFPIMASFFKNYKEEMERKVVCTYIFVDIKEPPKFFIVKRDDVRQILDDLIRGYLDKRKETAITETKKQQWTIRQSLIEKYKDNWDAIMKELR